MNIDMNMNINNISAKTSNDIAEEMHDCLNQLENKSKLDKKNKNLMISRIARYIVSPEKIKSVDVRLDLFLGKKIEKLQQQTSGVRAFITYITKGKEELEYKKFMLSCLQTLQDIKKNKSTSAIKTQALPTVPAKETNSEDVFKEERSFHEEFSSPKKPVSPASSSSPKVEEQPSANKEIKDNKENDKNIVSQQMEKKVDQEKETPVKQAGGRVNLLADIQKKKGNPKAGTENTHTNKIEQKPKTEEEKKAEFEQKKKDFDKTEQERIKKERLNRADPQNEFYAPPRVDNEIMLKKQKARTEKHAKALQELIKVKPTEENYKTELAEAEQEIKKLDESLNPAKTAIDATYWQLKFQRYSNDEIKILIYFYFKDGAEVSPEEKEKVKKAYEGAPDNYKSFYNQIKEEGARLLSTSDSGPAFLAHEQAWKELLFKRHEPGTLLSVLRERGEMLTDKEKKIDQAGKKTYRKQPARLTARTYDPNAKTNLFEEEVVKKPVNFAEAIKNKGGKKVNLEKFNEVEKRSQENQQTLAKKPLSELQAQIQANKIE